MKTFTVFLVLLFYTATNMLYAQKKGRVDFLEYEKDNFFSTQFTSLFNGFSKNGIGTFASVENVSGTFSFSYHKVKQGNVLGFKLTGGSSDGIAAVFTNSKLNTNVGLEFNYHFLNNKRFIRVKWGDDISEYREIQDKIKRYKDTIAKEKYRIGNDPKLSHLERLYSINDIQKDYSKKIESLEKAKEIEVTAFSFGWISLGYSTRHDAFRLFDEEQEYDNQVSSDSFIAHNLNISYSHYNWNSIDNWQTYYFSGGIVIKHRNNIEDLAKVEIVEENIFESAESSRSVSKKYNAFTGDYKEDVQEVMLYSDFYYFPFNGDVGALHLSPNVRIPELQKPIWNMDIGYVFSFKNVKKNEADVNLELFYRIKDISNTLNLSGVAKNFVGLRATVPVNFK